MTLQQLLARLQTGQSFDQEEAIDALRSGGVASVLPAHDGTERGQPYWYAATIRNLLERGDRCRPAGEFSTR